MKRITTLFIFLCLFCGISIAQSVDSIHAVEFHSSIPQGVWITTVITTSATFITIITGIVFIIWFVRDIRKENSKNLKIQTETLNKHTEILMKIEEGQRIGFKALAEILERIVKSSERMEKSSEKLVKSSERREKSSERMEKRMEKNFEIQTMILEKIGAKN